MTTLATADGRLLRSSGPSRFSNTGLRDPFNLGTNLGLRPLWSSGDQVDEYGWHDTSGRHISFEGAYCSFPAVAAAANKLTRQGSTIPVKVYERLPGGRKRRVYDDSTDRGGGLVALLNKPAPRRGPADWKQWILLPAAVQGNSVLAKWRGEGKDSPPTELMPMEWSFLDPLYRRGGEVEVWVTTELGDPRWISADDVVHCAWHATNGPLGVSPLQPLRDTLRLENAAVRTQTSSFRNGAHPSGLVVPGDVQTVTKETLTEMKNQMQALFSGPDNAFKVAALAPGSSWTPLKFDSQEAELMATRVFNRIDVCAAYDIKPPVLGYIEQANYASIKEINQDFYRTSLRPWLTMIEERLQAQLIDPEPEWQGLFCEFDLNEQLRGEPSAVADQIKTEIESGTLTPNEGRAIQNRQPSTDPHADELWMPTNNFSPMSQWDQAVQPGEQTTLPGTNFPA